ncbi:TetR/AcrR family transcriptional regulator [Actinophytocola sp. KF-1]
MTSNETGGLRERKKAATREALSKAALRLAMEKGMSNVRVQEVAGAANVSPRTYNNYFSSVEQAIVWAIMASRAVEAAEAVRMGPEEEPLADSVIEAVVGQYANPPEGDMLRLVTTAPRLRAEYVEAVTGLSDPLAAAIAERLDTDDRLLPAVLASAVSAAARVAIESWVQPSENPEAAAKGLVVVVSGRPLPDLLREALAGVAPALRAAEEAARKG